MSESTSSKPSSPPPSYEHVNEVAMGSRGTLSPPSLPTSIIDFVSGLSSSVPQPSTEQVNPGITPQVQQSQFGASPSTRGRRSRQRSARKSQVTPITPPIGKPRDPNHLVLGMVVDRSGSMASMGAELEGGCNAYLETQRSEDARDGGRSTILFTRFDNVSEVVYDAVDLPEIPTITHEMVQPRGSTALYDAIGDTMQRVSAHLETLEKIPDVVIFILTDGHENASQSWTKAAINREISKLEKEHEWEFYFAAANQDAMVEGSGLGMKRSNCMTFGQSGVAVASKMKTAFTTASTVQNDIRKGRRPKYDGFSLAERKTCA